jgi:hypothetical protein
MGPFEQITARRVDLTAGGRGKKLLLGIGSGSTCQPFGKNAFKNSLTTYTYILAIFEKNQ